MRMPDFFILGAPKCGTTAIYTYMCAHPGVFMSPIKEPNHFSFDLPGIRGVADERDYLQLFAAAPCGAVIGEASASYLFSEAAIPEITQRNPAAKMIAILRNPIDMAYALHAERVRNLTEDIVEFERAWDLQDERRKGRFLPRHPEPKMLQYREICSFGNQIERLFEHTLREQRAVYIFEEFEHNPRRTYLDILKFLDLADDGRSEFPRVHSNRVLRSRRLAQFQQLTRNFFKKRGWYSSAKAAANAVGFQPSHIMNQWRMLEAARPPLRQGFRRRLSEELKDDVRKIEGLLGRRLACWKDWAAPKIDDAGAEKEETWLA